MENWRRDPWFDAKAEEQGYIRRDDWLASFYPGPNEELEEITDPTRWERRVVRGRRDTWTGHRDALGSGTSRGCDLAGQDL